MIVTKERLKTALALAEAVMKGEEFVPRSKHEKELVPGCCHPDGPGWCTRGEIYYDFSWETGQSCPASVKDPRLFPGTPEQLEEKAADDLRWDELQEQLRLLLDEKEPLQEALKTLNLKIQGVNIELEELNRKVYLY